MPNLQANDQLLRQVLTQTQVIAVVGHSDQPHRTSYQIAQFLRQVGYTVYPVNPTVTAIDSQPSFPSLSAVPEPVQLVNVFRRSEYLPEIVDQAIALGIPTIWTQLGVGEPTSALKAIQAGLNVMMNACIKVEYLRLGINTSHHSLSTKL